jgi:RHS repeat-associated protein
VRQVVGGATTEYTLDVLGLADVLMEHTSGGTAAYFYGLGLLGTQLPGGARRFYGLDGLGSVRLVSGASGALLATHDYDPFGVPRGGLSTPFSYTGQQWDGGVGLLYLRARYYDPQLGRFLSRDPFSGLLTIPQSLHPYSYVFNNPATLRDPSGKFVNILIRAIIGGAIGGTLYWISAGECFEWRDFWTVVGAGAIAGGLIGSGVGILALAGVGAGASGAGYLTVNLLTSSRFLAKDFLIAFSVGGVAGALAPVAGSTVLATMTLEATANVTQYGLTEYTSGREPSLGGIAWSAVTGAIAGGVAGPYRSPQLLRQFDLSSPWLDQSLLKAMLREEIVRTSLREFPRSASAAVISNLPEGLLSQFGVK